MRKNAHGWTCLLYTSIRKALPKEFAYVLEELLTERGDLQDKESYYDAIVQTIVRVGRAKAFIIALSELIQRLTVDHLHIVGDICLLYTSRCV